MPKVRDTSMIVVGALGFVAVAAGGLGTHVLDPYLTPEEKKAWGLAMQFNLVHAAALMAVFATLKNVDPDSSASRNLTRSFYLLLAGTVLFAGSIYAMCLGAPPKTVGPLTPVGGITLMLGWIFTALAGF
ncbi:uncharacterized protein TM35_000141430 [Trypanosoma theileri]|uniref:DUF423 domain-containing protein n=1 Tax=Trypanosoma theileri TaxID=67003 RepID=A0A1X0NW75_9TRYP|nr:uncharacterized protein TM35_000141430 [Trypanosoma theileri]ORC88932.1 hypothetical protein TM35_000141430 [Trypanosoma theileri]